VAFALSFLLSPGHFWPLIPFMMLVGASMAGLFLLPGAMVPDTVDHDAKISGLRREGTIYGAWICVQQTGMALGAFLVGVYLDLIGHQSAPRASAATTEPTLIKFGFAFGPLLLAIAAILLLRKYTLASRSGDEESPVSGVLPVLYKE
jgi:Na+/melibiose symporter-like transporter